MEKLGKIDLARKMVEGGRVKTQKEAMLAIDSFQEAIKDILKAGDMVTLTGFGIFKTSIRKGRMASHPITQERIEVAEKTVAKFIASKSIPV
ncbi:MAG: HU family DNA-binding protein [Fusobacteriaceae bacterium]